ncbi:MAG: ribonuclease P protein component [Alistipes sp.]|nr:ribonuclease P protein component [Alistipes sp.]
MNTPSSLPKTERLHSLTALRRLFAEGTSGFVYPFRYMTFTESCDQPSVEVVFSVPKRYHKRAVRRNLLRRRTKEAYRLSKQVVVEHAKKEGIAIDVALIYSSKEPLPYKTIANAVRKILAQIVEGR